MPNLPKTKVLQIDDMFPDDIVHQLPCEEGKKNATGKKRGGNRLEVANEPIPKLLCDLRASVGLFPVVLVLGQPGSDFHTLPRFANSL